MLKTGDQLLGQFGGMVTVKDVLGEGSQGAVYKGLNEDGSFVAVKWYSPAFQTSELRAGISELIMKSAPSPRFLWPDDLLIRGGEFGYSMALRPRNYRSVPEILSRRVAIKFRELVQSANQTVSAFKKLQSQGLFYCDISEGNLFVNPDTGDILICDNDNVGSTERLPGVLGTPRYMAPEIVRGEALPSPQTDSYSMAILLFLLLFNDHPLEGARAARIRCLDAAAMRELYGFHPTFIFDPADSTNRPESGVQTNASIYWSMYPAEVKEVFTKAFTVGLHDSRRRPTFADWQRALGLLQDSIVYCSNCDRQNFYDESKAKLKCWSCASVIKTPLKLRIDDRRFLMLNRDTKLYSYQVTRRGEDPGDRGSPIGEVLKHPKIDVRGLRNLGKKPWRSVNPNGVIASVVPGSSVLLSVGTKIEFEELTAEIEST